MATYYVDDGGGKSVTAATNANPCQVTITGHGFSTNDKVVFHNIGGMTQLNFTNGSTGYTVTVVDANNITIGVDSTAYGTYTSGGTAHNGKSWGAAFISVSALDDVFSLGAPDIIYIGHDHVCQYTHTTNRNLALNGTLISATTGSSPPVYQVSSSNQVDTSEGAYFLNITAKAIYGCKFKAGGIIYISIASSTMNLARDCTLAPASGSYARLNDGSGGKTYINNLTIDLTSDGTTPSAESPLWIGGSAEVAGLNFINAGYRTGSIINFVNLGNVHGSGKISGADLSGFTNATTCEVVNRANNYVDFLIENCKTAATWTAVTGTPAYGGTITFKNVGSGTQPTSVMEFSLRGDITSTTSIYRSTGATIEGSATSWLVTTTSSCSQDSIFYSPEIYGYISSTGSKTFDLYITNDTADFYDNDVWLEIDYLGTASSGQWSHKTDYMADRLATAALQADDTGSTWNGSGPSYTYKQKLSVTATVNTAGMFRARVCVGVASISSTRKFYIDPLVTVS